MVRTLIYSVPICQYFFDKLLDIFKLTLKYQEQPMHTPVASALWRFAGLMPLIHPLKPAKR
jgi:hypothetical protein